jgi:integrase/recombinase XerD
MHSCVTSRIARVENACGHDSSRALLDAFKFDCQLKNLTQKTLDCYFERIGYLIKHCKESGTELAMIDRGGIQRYILSLRGKVSDETVNGRIRVYRRFFGFLKEDQLWHGEDPMKGIGLLKTAKRIKPIVDPEQVQQMIQRLNRKTFEGNRNLVMLLLLWDGMLRCNELLNLRTKELNLDSRLLKVFGKGRKERMVPLGTKTLKILHQYLILWRKKYPGEHLI